MAQIPLRPPPWSAILLIGDAVAPVPLWGIVPPGPAPSQEEELQGDGQTPPLPPL